MEIMLITSRRRKRWIIPKGVVEQGLSAPESASKEAFEEAGIRGWVHPNSTGEYHYHKWGGTCRVEVFVLEVEEVLEEWPESSIRQRKWMSIEAAAALVDEPVLKQMIWNLTIRSGDKFGREEP